GKPFVAGGNVYYTTYIANPNRCEPGTGRLYGLDFDDFTTPVIAPFQPGVGGPLTSPSVVFTPDGRASLTLPVGTSVYTVTVPGLAPSAQMIHWGRVL
ncbi:MAG TPA: hypothetical protein P5076_25460, partial [Myxococcota bacterium]|nr:hypothetical protein [Myxococcota bacterium]